MAINKTADKNLSAGRRSARVRSKVIGTAKRPRLSIYISHLHLGAQIIDDTKQQTLVAATTVGSKQTGTMTDKAVWLGEQIAAKAKKAKITKVVMDRSSRRYHGRIKALAEAARNNGLEF